MCSVGLEDQLGALNHRLKYVSMRLRDKGDENTRLSQSYMMRCHAMRCDDPYIALRYPGGDDGDAESPGHMLSAVLSDMLSAQGMC